MKKTILTLAILAALPFGAWADTLTITNDDKQHIASTAYVKGAYNATMNAVDTKLDKSSLYGDSEIGSVAADIQNGQVLTGSDVNQLNSYVASAYSVINTMVQVGDKQDKLVWSDPEGEVDDMYVDTSILNSVDDAEYPNQLVSGLGIKNAIDNVNDSISAVDTKIDNKRVEIYTTWDNDNATKPVALTTVSQ